MQHPMVSIIIVNYNGRELLESCLGSLESVTYPNYEVVLVDNNSDDDSVDFVRRSHPSVNIVKLGENRGFAEPNNIGSRLARGELLLFLNNDTVVEPDFLAELVAAAGSDPRIAMCQSLLLRTDGEVDSGGDFIDSLGVAYSSRARPEKIQDISSGKGASLLIKKRVFDELDGFDERFFASFEDVDLGWRSWIRGYRSVVVPASIVHHLGSQTTRRISSQIAFHGFKNQLSMKLTNFESGRVIPTMLSFFTVYAPHELRIWLDYKLRGRTERTATKYERIGAQKPSLAIICRSVWWVMTHPSYLVHKHRRVNSSRVYGTDYLREHNIIR